MSETVRLRAKVKRVATDETQVLEIFTKEGIDLGDKNIKNLMSEHDLWEKYIYSQPFLYEIVDSNEKEAYEDLFQATICNDGTIDIIAQYYNGGCGETEAIEYALNKLDDSVQYTITENNDHEGETWGYIIYPTDEQLNQIIDVIDEDEEESFSIEVTNYTEDQVKLINDHFDGYMERLSFREVPDKIDLDTIYKGSGLKRISGN